MCVNTPQTLGLNSQSVAEVALMLMLMLLRRVDEGRAVFAEGRIGEPVGREVSVKKKYFRVC